MAQSGAAETRARLVWYGRVAVIALGVAALFVVLVGTLLPRLYVSKASLLFALPANNVLDLSPAGISNWVDNGRLVPAGSDFPLSTYYAVLNSNQVLEQAAAACDIPARYELKNRDSVLAWMDRHVELEMKADRTIGIKASVTGTPSIRSVRDLVDRPHAYARDNEAKELSARLAQAVIDQLSRVEDEIKLDRSKARVISLRQRLATERKVLDEVEGKLEGSQTTFGAPNPMAMSEAFSTKMVDLMMEVDRIDARLANQLRARQLFEQRLSRQLSRLESLSGQDPLLLDQRDAFLKAREEYQMLSRKYGPQNAEVLEARAALDQAGAALDKATETVQQGLLPELIAYDVEVAALEAERNSMARSLDDYRTQLQGLPSELLEVDRLKENVIRQRQLVVKLQATMLEAEAEYEQRGVQWSVLDRPVPPENATSPRLKTALAGGLLLGILIATLPKLREKLAEWVQVARDLSRQEPA